MKCLICTNNNDDSNNKIGSETTVEHIINEDNNLLNSCSQFKRDVWSYFCSHFHVSNHKYNNNLQLPFCLKCEKDVNQLFKLNCNLIKIQKEMQHLTANISSSILLTASSLNSKTSNNNDKSHTNHDDDLSTGNDGKKKNDSGNSMMDQDMDKIREEITQYLNPQVVVCDLMWTNAVKHTQTQNQNKSTESIKSPPAGKKRPCVKLETQNQNNSTETTPYPPAEKNLISKFKLEHQSNVINNSRENSNNPELLPRVVYICQEPECDRRKFCNIEFWKNHQKYHQLPKTVKKHEYHPNVYTYKDEWAFKEIVERKNEYQCLTCDKILKYYTRICDHVRDVHADPPNCECGHKTPFRYKLTSHLKDKVCWSGKQMERWITVQDEEGIMSFLYDNIWPISILETRLNIKWTDPDASFRCETCGFESRQRGLMTEHIQKFHLNPDSTNTLNNNFMDSWRPTVQGDELETDVNVRIKIDHYPQADTLSVIDQAENFLNVEIKTEADVNDNLELQSENTEELFNVENQDVIYDCEFEYETVLQDDPGVLPFLHEEVTEVISQCEYELSSSSASTSIPASPFPSKSTVEEGEIVLYKQWSFVDYGKGNLVCHTCGAKELSQTNMETHIEIYHAKENFDEYWEDESTTDSDNPVQNKKRKKNKVNWSAVVDHYPCNFKGCSKSYSTLEELELHKKIHSGKRIKCRFPGCTFTFVQESVMSTHMWAVHKMRFTP